VNTAYSDKKTSSSKIVMAVWRTTLALGTLLSASSASAEVELSFYGGLQTALPSDVTISDDDVIPDTDINIAWEGRSLEPPPYYGLRVTSWESGSFGYGLDFTHAKVYPQDGELPDDFNRIEFTDGLNTLTVNAYYRWQDVSPRFTPYVGGGLGLSVPHVEVTTSDSRTLGYQFTGPAATVIAGASVPINDSWSVFGEYKGTFTSNEGDLDTGGTVDTDIVTNAVNVGVTFNF